MAQPLKAEQEQLAAIAMQDLKLEYNKPLKVPQFFKAACSPTAEAPSLLQVQNLSTTFNLTYVVLYGGTSYTGNIPANNPDPVTKIIETHGSKLVVSNVSGQAATARVTLLNT